MTEKRKFTTTLGAIASLATAENVLWFLRGLSCRHEIGDENVVAYALLGMMAVAAFLIAMVVATTSVWPAVVAVVLLDLLRYLVFITIEHLEAVAGEDRDDG